MTLLQIAEFLSRTVVAFGLLFAFTVSTFSVIFRFMPPLPLAVRWTAAFIVAVWLLQFLFHILLVLGQFHVLAASIAIFGFLFSMHGFLGIEVKDIISRVGLDLRIWARALRRAGRKYPFIFGLIITLMVLRIIRVLILPILGWDGITYHAPKASMWVQNAGEISFRAPGGWELHGDRLGGAEALMSWAILPFHSDLLLPLIDIISWIWLLLVTIALCAEFKILGFRRWSIAAYVIFIPVVFHSVGSGYNDILAAASILTSFVFGCRWLREQRAFNLVLFFVALGVCSTIKLSNLASVALMFCVVVGALILRRCREQRAFGAFFCGGVAAAIIFLPWLVWAYLRTGYPFGGISFEVAGVPLGHSAASDWYLLRDGLNAFNIKDEIAALGYVFRAPWSNSVTHLSWVSLLPCVIAPIGLLKLTTSQPWKAILAISLIGGIAGFYFSPEFSAIRLLWATTNGRLLLPVISMSLLISFYGLRFSRNLSNTFGWLLVAATVLHGIRGIVWGWGLYELILVPLVVSCILLISAICIRRRIWISGPTWLERGGLIGMGVFVLLLALQLVRDETRYLALKQSTIFHDIPRYWVSAAQALDTPDKPRRIAVTSGPEQNADNLFLYYFLGKRLQNELVYVAVTADGQIQPLLPGPTKNSNFWAWYARLNDQAVSDVVSFKPSSLELSWMEGRRDLFQRQFGDGSTWGTYRVLNVEEGRL